MGPRAAASRLLFSLLILASLLPGVVGSILLVRSYTRYAHLVDARLSGARGGPTRLYSRPLLLRPGAALSPEALLHRLNALAYEERRSGVPGAGQFVMGESLVTVRPRDASEPLLVFFDKDAIVDLRGLVSQKRYAERDLGREIITDLQEGPRSKRRPVPFDELPRHLVQCVLAAEDRRFFHHPGVDLFRTAAAALKNFEAESYVQGGSTITQQLVKNFFLTPEKTIRRKLQEALFAFALEHRASKKEILELYLNEVYLGQVGSFSVHGVGEGARLYFNKDVGNLTLGEAALLAGLIPSPNRCNPYRHPEDARTRRNVVLAAARNAGFLSAEDADAAAAEPLRMARETLVSEAPYFVDLVRDHLTKAMGGNLPQGFSVYTTLDPYLQVVAQDALRAGLARAETPRGKKRRARTNGAPLQGSVVVLEPKTGAVVALVGGRSYESSQFDRATEARRQPGSTFKPFVYLAAFEESFTAPARPPLTPATLVEDAPTTFLYEAGEYAPANSEDRYLGLVTLRRALAMSLNTATLKVAEFVGFDHIARVASSALARKLDAYPSLALGSLEVTPLEMATSFGIFANGGVRIPPVVWTEVRDDEGTRLPLPRPPTSRVAHAESTFLVTNMMRSVIDEGTAASSRGLGLKGDAAGKTGTTNDERDAWFIGFTPDLLCAVWVGYDDNHPLRLSGAEAALPIWVDFMKKATAGQKAQRFKAPPGVEYVEIDKESGLLATAYCPKKYKEAFISGAAPTDPCPWHSADGGSVGGASP